MVRLRLLNAERLVVVVELRVGAHFCGALLADLFAEELARANELVKFLDGTRLF